ncbi:MAG: lytic transglycosylase domain-containing protein [Acidiferrobacterales bacterium]
MKPLIIPTLVGGLVISLGINLLQYQKTQQLERQVHQSEYDVRSAHHLMDVEEEYLQMMIGQVRNVAGIENEFKARHYAQTYIDAANEYHLDARLLLFLALVESSFDAHAKSHKGALGMMQVMPKVWLENIDFIADDKDLMDPYLNIHAGAHVLRHYLDRADGNVKLALLMYNRGEGTVNKEILKGLDPSNGFARKILHGRALPAKLDRKRGRNAARIAFAQ